MFRVLILGIFLINCERAFASFQSSHYKDFECELRPSFDGKDDHYYCILRNRTSCEDFKKITYDDFDPQDNFINLAIYESTIVKLCENMFDHVPFKKLRTIYADEISLERIDKNVFSKTVAWGWIGLSHNLLTTLINGSFEGITADFVHVSHNLIESIELDAFKDASIEKLSLYGNRIISMDFLNSMHMLKFVDLSDNKIEQFTINMLKPESMNQHPSPIFDMSNNTFKAINCSSNLRVDVLNLNYNELLKDINTEKCDIEVIKVFKTHRELQTKVGNMTAIVKELL
jgi:hypothetical protein